MLRLNKLSSDADNSLTVQNLSSSKRNALICLALLVATTAVYWPVFFSQFLAVDDHVYVTGNPVVQQGLNANGIAWAFSEPHSANYHPLTWLSHMLDCQMFGLNPAGHHGVSLLIHCINVLLVYVVLRSLTGRNRCSAIVAALFAIHPVHVESVAWVAERKDVLSGMFFLLTLGAWSWYAHRSSKRAWAGYALAILFCAAAMLSKPTTVTLPAVLLLLDIWPLGRTRWVTAESLRTDADPVVRSVSFLLLEKTPFIVMSVLSCLTTALAQRIGGAVATTQQMGWGIRISNALISYTRYLRNFMWPAHLSAFYPFNRPWPVTAAIGAAVLLAAITAVCIWQARRRPYLAIGWFWFVGMLVPMIGLMQVGNQSMADRYMYLPMIGLTIMIVWAGAELFAFLQQTASQLQTDVKSRVSGLNLSFSPLLVRRAGFAMIAVTLMSFSALCASQVRWWHDSEILFTRAIEQTEPSVFALNTLGSAYLLRGANEQAIARFEQSAALQPTNPNVLCALGGALREAHQYPAAIKQMELALKVDPHDARTWNELGHVYLDQHRWKAAADHFAIAVNLRPTDYDGWINLAVSHRQIGENASARVDLETALKLYPRIAQPWYMYGLLLLETGDAKAALPVLRRATTLDPKSADGQYRYALALMKTGHGEQAVEPLLASVHLAPASPEPLAKLAWLLATYPDANFRRGGDAIYFAERANALSQSSPQFLAVLAAAYAEQKQFAQAAKTATEAAQLADATGDTGMANRMQTAASQYRDGEATRDASLAGADAGEVIP